MTPLRKTASAHLACAVIVVLLLGLPITAYAGQRWAVVVGVDDYGGNTVSLKYAEKDARRFRDLLLQDTPTDHIRFLTTAGLDADKPTGVSIVAAVRQIMGKAGPDDEFWFFFSGHGQDEGKAHYLIPADYRVSNLHECGVDLVQIRALLNRSCAARHKILIVDACHSGSDDPISYGDATDTSTVVLTSCRSNEESWEIPALQEGAFAYYLLAEMMPSKDAKGTRILSEDVARRVQAQVTNCVRHAKHKTQTPQIFGHLPSGGLVDIEADAVAPPGEIMARVALGPAVVVEFTEERTLRDGSRQTSDYAQAAFSAALVHQSFPLVDRVAARELDGITGRPQAAAKARQLGARYMIRAQVHTVCAPPDDFTGLLSVQASSTLELIDENGRVLFQQSFAPTASDPQDHADLTETGAASGILQTLGDKMANAVVPKLRETWGRAMTLTAP